MITIINTKPKLESKPSSIEAIKETEVPTTIAVASFNKNQLIKKPIMNPIDPRNTAENNPNPRRRHALTTM